VRADLPGLTKDDINIAVADDAITIRGERRQEREESEEGFYRSERSYGSFYRQIPLPEGVSAEDAEATFRDGVLEITMPAPQRAEQRSRRLEIKESSEGEAQPQRGRAQAAGK
jgi:HSP20 family protein